VFWSRSCPFLVRFKSLSSPPAFLTEVNALTSSPTPELSM
jgi:hypothetical protein